MKAKRNAIEAHLRAKLYAALAAHIPVFAQVGIQGFDMIELRDSPDDARVCRYEVEMPTLPTPPAPRRRTGASTAAHRTDATPSQLDIIAEINARTARHHWGRQAQRMAVAGGAVLLGAALWWLTQGGAAPAPAPPLPTRAVPVEQAARSVSTAVAVPALTDPAATPAQGALPASSAVEVTAAPLTETAAAADDRARKARARREAEARAAELQVQQERSRAEAQERQQREAEREAQQARELADVANRRAAEQAPAPAQPAAEARRGVRERCSASGNIFSELFCQSRECRKPEYANDALCIRLREIEEAKRGGGQ